MVLAINKIEKLINETIWYPSVTEEISTPTTLKKVGLLCQFEV